MVQVTCMRPVCLWPSCTRRRRRRRPPSVEAELGGAEGLFGRSTWPWAPPPRPRQRTVGVDEQWMPQTARQPLQSIACPRKRPGSWTADLGPAAGEGAWKDSKQAKAHAPKRQRRRDGRRREGGRDGGERPRFFWSRHPARRKGRARLPERADAAETKPTSKLPPSISLPPRRPAAPPCRSAAVDTRLPRLPRTRTRTPLRSTPLHR